MPFKPPETAKCPKCQKSVYAAEEKVAGGHKWHKSCFKCEMCNKMLDSTNCAPHDDKLFCKNCHGRKYGPKGYGFGGGAGALSMDTGAQFGNTEGEMSGDNFPKGPTPSRKIIPAPEGEGCPRCGGCVYAAEQMLAKGRPWHKHCFKCRSCTKQLDSVTHNDGPDGEVYCKLCYSKKFGPKGYGYGGGAGALQSDLVNGEERLEYVRPSKNLEASIKAPEGEGCPRCGGMVYAAEQMLAKGSVWHKKCFNCLQCRRPLDSINACDGPDKEIYCKTCYGKKFGPKGYGFGGGSGFLQTDVIQTEDAIDLQSAQPRWIPPEAMNTAAIKGSSDQNCPRCGGAVFAAEQMLARGTMWHKKCYNCKDCHRPLDSVNACDAPNREILCKACYAKTYGPKGFGYGSTPTLVSGTEGVSAPIEPNVAALGVGQKAPPGEGCQRCGFMVYAAEMMISHGRPWHKRCFSCFECHKSLDSTNLCDGPDKEIYCKGHYQSKFGIKGVGYGMGAGVLTMN